MGIFDRFTFANKKTEPQKPAAPKGKAAYGALYQETNVYGLVEYLSNMPDIDETLQMAGIQRRDLRRLESDDEISTALETRLLGVMSTPIRFESKDDASLAFIQEEIQPHLDTIIRHAWQAIPYGYSVMEMIYRRLDGNRIGIDSVLNKPFHWFQPHPDGSLSPWGLVDDKLDQKWKFFMTRRNPSYIQPYGEAVLSRLYWAWFFRQQGWDHWMRWLARYGTPPLIGEADAHQLQEMQTALIGAVNAAAVAVPTGGNVTVANPAAGSKHFPEFESAVTKRIQKMILGQTLTTDVGKTGSFAAAKVHDGVRDDKRIADAKLVSNTVQRIVDALVTLNGLQPVSFIMEDERQLNPERATRDATLVNAGMVQFSREYLLRAYDFDDDDLEDVQATPSNTPPNNQKTGAKAALSGDMLLFSGVNGEKQAFTKSQQGIENLGDTVIAQAQSPISEDAIKMAIRTSSNADEMMDKLATLAEGYTPEAFAELTERAMFAADVFGYVKSEQGKV